MSEERHTVLVHENQVQEYLERGYCLEPTSAVEYMRESPLVLHEHAQIFANHRVMSVGIEAKKKLDTPRRKYALRTVEHVFVPNRLEVRRYDILEENNNTLLHIVADSDHDEGTREMSEFELFDTPRECVHAARAQLLREVEKLRAAADGIIAFLKGHEAL